MGDEDKTVLTYNIRRRSPPVVGCASSRLLVASKNDDRAVINVDPGNDSL